MVTFADRAVFPHIAELVERADCVGDIRAGVVETRIGFCDLHLFVVGGSDAFLSFGQVVVPSGSVQFVPSSTFSCPSSVLKMMRPAVPAAGRPASL